MYLWLTNQGVGLKGPALRLFASFKKKKKNCKKKREKRGREAKSEKTPKIQAPSTPKLRSIFPLQEVVC